MQTTALILAGGAGKRFAPLKIRKPLFPIFDKTLLEHQLLLLKQQGFLEAVVVVAPDIEKEVEKISVPGIQPKLIVQREPNGMADAVITAKEVLGDRPVLIQNATSFYEASLYRSFFDIFDGDDPAIAARKVDVYFPGGYLKFNGDKLEAIIEKPGEGKQPSNLLNTVFHYFPEAGEFISILESTQSRDDDIYERSLSKLIAKRPVRVVEYEGDWASLKYPFHALDLTDFFLTHYLKPANHAAHIAKTAVIDDNVFLGEGVEVYDFAVIKGPAYLGPEVVVGNHALVRGSIIEANSTVGFSSEVARSYIGSDCKLHNSYVGDSVLEAAISMGSGAKTANLRLDNQEIQVEIADELINSGRRKLGTLIAQNANIGINASIMPGIKIGEGSIVGPATLVDRDVDPHHRFFANQTVINRKAGI